MKKRDKYRGCLIGGAAGDALGYAVEFDIENEIFQNYGEGGITRYELFDGVAQISDDTQMTLFTVNGLLLARDMGNEEDADTYVDCVARAYQDWLKTQSFYDHRDRANETCTWLMDVPELYDRRAPGGTCLDALESGVTGTIEKPINNSKGCGGVMRVAPVGLLFEGDAVSSGADTNRPEGMATDGGTGSSTCMDPDMIGARVAAITHGHELGYIPAATLTHIIRKIVHEDATIEDAVTSALDAAEIRFEGAGALPAYLKLMKKAVCLAREDVKDLDAIHELGEGWVGEEALAIAVYCALRYPDDIDRALIAAVNHSGDSDSTGAIAGNIVGASVGLEGIPDKYKRDLELFDVIIRMADELCGD